MAELIVAVFDTAAHADAAETDLQSKAIVPSTAIRRYAPGDPGSPHISQTTAETASPRLETPRHEGGGFFSWLFGEETEHTSHEDRALYDEHVNAGRIIISVRAADHQEAAAIMRVLEGHSPTEVEAQPSGTDLSSSSTTSTIRSEPEAGVSTEREAGVSAAAARPSTTSDTTREEVIPLAEEQLEVGKRVVDRGTTRIRRYVVEKPVEAQVNLRDETTTIERRAPSSSASAPAAGAFEDRVVEVHETSEQPMVSKTPQVVEEVVVHREATDRTETVKDTVRREEVEVDKATTTEHAADHPSTTTTTTHSTPQQ